MRRALLVLLLVPACGLALTAAASAHAVVHVSGTDLGPDAGTTSCHPINSAGTLLSCDTPDFATRYSGDLTGTISTDFRWVINCSSGVIDGQGAETFTGSVARVGIGHAEVGDEVPRRLRLQHPEPVEPARHWDHHFRYRSAGRTARHADLHRPGVRRNPARPPSAPREALPDASRPAPACVTLLLTLCRRSPRLSATDSFHPRSECGTTLTSSLPRHLAHLVTLQKNCRQLTTLISTRPTRARIRARACSRRRLPRAITTRSSAPTSSTATGT